MLDIYDANLGLLRIGPFNYEPLRGVDLWLQQTDEFIVQHLSPSPEVEAPNFAMKVRRIWGPSSPSVQHPLKLIAQ